MYYQFCFLQLIKMYIYIPSPPPLFFFSLAMWFLDSHYQDLIEKETLQKIGKESLILSLLIYKILVYTQNMLR